MSHTEVFTVYLWRLRGEGLYEVRFMVQLGLLFLICLPSSHLLQLLFFSVPFQDLLDSDWASVRKVLEQADILVIKYSVTDKLAFQQVRNGYAPRLRPLLRHWGVPVILVAVGARLNGEDAFVLCFRYSWSEFSFAYNASTTDGSSDSVSLLCGNIVV